MSDIHELLENIVEVMGKRYPKNPCYTRSYGNQHILEMHERYGNASTALTPATGWLEIDIGAYNQTIDNAEDICRAIEADIAILPAKRDSVDTDNIRLFVRGTEILRNYTDEPLIGYTPFGMVTLFGVKEQLSDKIARFTLLVPDDISSLPEENQHELLTAATNNSVDGSYHIERIHGLIRRDGKSIAAYRVEPGENNIYAGYLLNTGIMEDLSKINHDDLYIFPASNSDMFVIPVGQITFSEIGKIADALSEIARQTPCIYVTGLVLRYCHAAGKLVVTYY